MQDDICLLYTSRWEWDVLREEVKKHGARNSLLLAPMPTASTAQILGNNECFEPYTSNIYTRRVLSGEFVVVNKFLLRDLVKLGLWGDDMKNKIISLNGSVQNIPEIPQNLKELYKTAWEISQKVIIDMAADRGAYICQSQSLNIFMENVNFAKLTSMHFYSWKAGLKTGMYYLPTKAATDAIKFTVDKAALTAPKEEAQVAVAASAAKVPVGSTVEYAGEAVRSTTVAEPVMSGPMVTNATPVTARAQARTEETATDGLNNPPGLSKLSAERLSAMTAAERKAAQAQAEIACSLDNPDACEMCSG